VCSCHFRDGVKSNGPEIYARNAHKLFDNAEEKKNTKKKKTVQPPTTVQDMVKEIKSQIEERNSDAAAVEPEIQKTPTQEIILKAELDIANRELKHLRESAQYNKTHYSVSNINLETLRMETGLPTRESFDIIIRHVNRFRDNICYFSGWRVEGIKLEDQIFITLMKVKQNYTNLHLANLFSCSDATISNIVLTFAHVLHKLLFCDTMKSIPSRHKNRTCSPSSFSHFDSCRIVIDCTDVKIARPSLMKHQSATYSSYRGMNSFKVIIGVSPNASITYVSDLYPGSISDKEIVEKSGLLNHLVAGDMILADKGFLIQSIVPQGVSVNIPPFLNNGKFTESEARATKSIAKCRIHVERANARLKDYKILNFIPSYLKCYVDVILQLCAALVNLQFPLIKEVCDGTECFE